MDAPQPMALLQPTAAHDAAHHRRLWIRPFRKCRGGDSPIDLISERRRLASAPSTPRIARGGGAGGGRRGGGAPERRGPPHRRLRPRGGERRSLRGAGLGRGHGRRGAKHVEHVLAQRWVPRGGRRRRLPPQIFCQRPRIAVPICEVVKRPLPQHTCVTNCVVS